MLGAGSDGVKTAQRSEAAEVEPSWHMCTGCNDVLVEESKPEAGRSPHGAAAAGKRPRKPVAGTLRQACDHVDDPYAAVARWYDRVLNPFLGSARQAVVAACHDAGIRTVLDLCCGTGDQLRRVEASGMRGVGVDISAGMLHVARGVLPEWSLCMADGAHLPFRDNAFDAAMVTLALHEMPLSMAEKLVSEGLRVAPRLLVVDYRLAERNLDLPAVFLTALLERMVGGEHYRNYRLFMRAGGMEGLITRCGLRVLRRERLFGGAGTLQLLDRA